MFKLSLLAFVVALVIAINLVVLASYVGEQQRQFTEEVDT